jgi:hypothetical protein
MLERSDPEKFEDTNGCKWRRTDNTNRQEKETKTGRRLASES